MDGEKYIRSLSDSELERMVSLNRDLYTAQEIGVATDEYERRNRKESPEAAQPSRQHGVNARIFHDSADDGPDCEPGPDEPYIKSPKENVTTYEMEKEADAKSREPIYCMACGCKLPPSALYCLSCGEKVEIPDAGYGRRPRRMSKPASIVITIIFLIIAIINLILRGYTGHWFH